MIRTTQAQIADLLRALGVKRGQAVMLHSTVYSLGVIEGGLQGLERAIMHVLGPEGTLIVPTFTYSFRRREVFDVANSTSALNIGVFAEHVRLHPQSIRSTDPMFSMASVGARATELMRRVGPMCFGPGSVYARLFDRDVTFVGLGVGYSQGLSGFIHLEKLADVPYREALVFKGKCLSLSGRSYDDTAHHFARREDYWPGATINRAAMGALLEHRGISRAISYGYGRHVALRGLDWKDAVLQELHSNPHAMLREPESAS